MTALVASISMSEEQLKAFLERVKGDTSLQVKLKAAADANAVVSIAKEAGFSISADDLKNAQSDLSDEELDSILGGGSPGTGGGYRAGTIRRRDIDGDIICG